MVEYRSITIQSRIRGRHATVAPSCRGVRQKEKQVPISREEYLLRRQAWERSKFDLGHTGRRIPDEVDAIAERFIAGTIDPVAFATHVLDIVQGRNAPPEAAR